MRLVYSHGWPCHLKMTSQEANLSERPRESLHEIYDIAIALDTAGYALNPTSSAIRSIAANSATLSADEVNLPSPILYVSAGFPCHTLLVFDATGRHIADVSLSLHSAEHVAGVPTSSEALLHRYHIGRVHIHKQVLYVADCEFDFVYVCDLSGDVRHVISWPDELCAPMGLCVGPDRLYVCDSGHKRVRVYNLVDYRPVPGEDSPGRFPGVHTRGVCRCGQSLVAGDFESGRILTLPDDGAPGQYRSVSVPGIGEPFALLPGPLPDTVLVSSSGLQGDHTIKLVSLAPGEGPAATLAECGGLGDAPGRFNKPRGIAFDPAARRLYAVDARNYRVQVFSLED